MHVCRVWCVLWAFGNIVARNVHQISWMIITMLR